MFDRIDRRTGKMLLIAFSAIAVIIFLIVSNNLVKELALQERERMDIWSKATEKLAKENVNSDFEFLLAIVAQNNSIPVLMCDGNRNISEFRNFSLPDQSEVGLTRYSDLSVRNREYLQKRLDKAAGGESLQKLARTDPHFIEVELAEGENQYIYFEDSRLLRNLSAFPYIQMASMLILSLIIYLAMVYTKRAEQNRVWAGLSKETAHQLGTPISSLMAWNEYLRQTGVGEDVTDEIDKDINRLSVIADRFSKIGSAPEMRPEPLNQTLENALSYMRNRVSDHVEISFDVVAGDCSVLASRPLIEWVMENLVKNAVDAMKGEGRIEITSGIERRNVWIEVRDTGRGIARKNFKTVFRPGYTTKKRGWGLGLTLVKRIVEGYHSGRIFVKWSEPGKGTIFRIELPLADS